MKVVILAGGRGSRITEGTQTKPKPLVEIGGKPIIWHIMKYYAAYGYHEFVICCGYKGRLLKEYFTHYYVHQANSTFFLEDERVQVHESNVEPWKVTLANTGLDTLTAGRLLKVREYIDGDEFFLTYCDCLSDVDIPALLRFHRENGRVVTITTTQPAGRFGAIKINPETQQVESFSEKARADQSWINAGFMVMSTKVFDYLGDGNSMLEKEPFERLSAAGEMDAYRHEGFWSPMDTLRDNEYLEELWKSGKAPWKIT